MNIFGTVATTRGVMFASSMEIIVTFEGGISSCFSSIQTPKCT